MIRAIWTITLVVNSISMIWFVLGSTAYFQRPLYLESILMLPILFVPSLVSVLFSVWLMVKGWIPSNGAEKLGVFLIIAFLVFASQGLYRNVDTKGWLYDKIISDPTIQVTSDEKYEYRLEIINFRQKNIRVQIFAINLITGEELHIPINIDANQTSGIVYGGGPWIVMEPTTVPNEYMLSTTDNLNIPIKTFIINMKLKNSRII